MMPAPVGPVLALESSTSIGSAAVGDAAGVRAEVVRSVAAGHSSGLLPAAEQAMQAAGLRPADLAAVVVGGGPGSFTGLRVAAATAKGMVQALGIPLFSYSGLLATAANGWASAVPVCALFDARRRDVYAACYRIGNREQGIGNSPPPLFPGVAGQGGRDSLFPVPYPVEVLMPPMALSIDDLVDRFRGGEPPLFAGEGALLHAGELRRELGARILPPHLGLPRAASLLWLVANAPELGAVEDSTAWEPEYIRASGAERIAAERQAPSGPG